MLILVIYTLFPMGLVNVDVNNVHHDNVSFNVDNYSTITFISFIAQLNRCKQDKVWKKDKQRINVSSMASNKMMRCDIPKDQKMIGEISM